MQSPFKRKKIGEILQELGVINSTQHLYVMDRLAIEDIRYGEVCVREGFIAEEPLSRALAEQFGLEFVDLVDFKPDESVLNSIPSDAMYRYHFLPLEQLGDSLVIAVADPTDVV